MSLTVFNEKLLNCRKILNCSGGSFYIGQTRRNLVKRLEEHQSSPNSEVCNFCKGNPTSEKNGRNVALQQYAVSITTRLLRRFSCRGYRTWPCLSCRVGYRCSLYCCLHVTFHLTIPASLLLPLPFVICINAICFLSARRFASLLLTVSRFSLILFLTVVLATATFFLLSFRTWNNFSYWILLSQLAGKTISVRITFVYCFLFFVCLPLI